MTLPCVCFIQSGQLGETPPHQAHPERFSRFVEYLRRLRSEASVEQASPDDEAAAFDLLEVAFPWPSTSH